MAHLGGGAVDSDDAYDQAGVTFPTVITGGRLAIYGIFWHNGCGRPHGHGWVNVIATVVPWLMRWTGPAALHKAAAHDTPRRAPAATLEMN